MLTKRVKTKDNFYPTCEDGTVAVSLHKDTHDTWRIDVWGDDDYGLQVVLHAKREAYKEFDSIKDGITIEELIKRGYVGA